MTCAPTNPGSSTSHDEIGGFRKLIERDFEAPEGAGKKSDKLCVSVKPTVSLMQVNVVALWVMSGPVFHEEDCVYIFSIVSLIFELSLFPSSAFIFLRTFFKIKIL